LPFDLFKLVDVTAECAFTLFPANTLVLSNVFGSLFKIPPLRSGRTSAQKIKKYKKKIERRPHEGTVQRFG
jgi:hypothetical protein